MAALGVVAGVTRHTPERQRAPDDRVGLRDVLEVGGQPVVALGADPRVDEHRGAEHPEPELGRHPRRRHHVVDRLAQDAARLVDRHDADLSADRAVGEEAGEQVLRRALRQRGRVADQPRRQGDRQVLDGARGDDVALVIEGRVQGEAGGRRVRARTRLGVGGSVAVGHRAVDALKAEGGRGGADRRRLARRRDHGAAPGDRDRVGDRTRRRGNVDGDRQHHPLTGVQRGHILPIGAGEGADAASDLLGAGDGGVAGVIDDRRGGARVQGQAGRQDVGDGDLRTVRRRAAAVDGGHDVAVGAGVLPGREVGRLRDRGDRPGGRRRGGAAVPRPARPAPRPARPVPRPARPAPWPARRPRRSRGAERMTGAAGDDARGRLSRWCCSRPPRCSSSPLGLHGQRDHP